MKLLVNTTAIVLIASSFAQAQLLELRRGDHVAVIGNNFADRMQHHAWLETFIQAAHPEHDLTFRNLGFTGDEVKARPRSNNFGNADQWLSKVEADVVLCFFGFNEAFRGEAGLATFEKELAEMIDGMRSQQYNGKSAPRIVVFSPIAHEDLDSPHLPDGSTNNQNLALYTKAMREVCVAKNVPFVDLFQPSRQLYSAANEPLTMNGVHLLDRGNKAIAEVIMRALFGKAAAPKSETAIHKIREAVLDKNYHWFSRYRVVDGYNVYGGRSKLAWDGVSNADVMRREMEIFDRMTSNRDKALWALLRGSEYNVVDSNLPEEVKVGANRQSQHQRGLGDYLEPVQAIDKMTIAKGMKVNLFASEKMFPELLNPVQMAVDTDSRLYVSVWPSYPHWNPTEPRKDRILILDDKDQDGVADKCTVFADELNSITGFEFWGGGMLVAAPPEIWFLKDTDGDDKADYKLRMLQGLSSADTHHSANAMVIGPDGGLYWSRGIFNVANMETPTNTYRSTKSGVHRFDPRTFEMSFHFPVGPNPHGDVFDQWGFQFANDGTSGTGSYVNIGKGIGNRQWFKKRVRPVAATGILSSPVFPAANQGNFLICNCIGFLGVLQHEVKYNGADITATEIEPILYSSDPNFRPTDVEIGGDGGLYVSDWSNALIGHMQHNMRDPNRDHAHGRIYRVTADGGKLLKPRRMKGKPIAEVLEAFLDPTNAVRYRARLELSGRETTEVSRAVAQWAAKLSPQDATEAQALLECLWVFEEHRVPNMKLLRTVFAAAEPRVRAAAIRTLGHWADKVDNWSPLLLAAARDDEPLVRAEAAKAAVSFRGLASAEVVFEIANRPTDPELDNVLKYATGRLDVDSIVKEAVASGKPLSLAAQTYVLRNAPVADLLKMKRTEAVYRAILSRPSASIDHLSEALTGLASMAKVDQLGLLLDLIKDRDAQEQTRVLPALGGLLVQQPAAKLRAQAAVLKKLATVGKTSDARQIGYAAWMAAEGAGANAFAHAARSKESLRHVLDAVAMVDAKTRGTLYPMVQPLIHQLPSGLASEADSTGFGIPGIQVDYFEENPGNVALETLAKLTPKASGIVPEIKIDVPQLGRRDAFALRFSGSILIDKGGDYTFFIVSDDGSRVYLDGKLLINNDGLHGMVEKSATVKLSPGPHEFMVTYFDNGGSDGLNVTYSGPGIRRQKIPADKLAIAGGETLHDVAINTLALLPGNDTQKFSDLAKVLRSEKNRTSAVRAMLAIDQKHWAKDAIAPLAQALAQYVSEIPAKYRTAKPALQAMQLTDQLASLLPAEQARMYQAKLADLKVNVIRIGTVKARMIFDKERLVVQAGKPVEFVFTNTDHMPHNFAIVQPGGLEEVGLLAEATARDKDAAARQYIPKSDKVMLASNLLQPGETQALSFEAPTKPGIYPYVCTYPGHWRRMFGALYVVADLKQYLANPADYLAKNELPLRDELLKYTERNTDWKYDDLIALVKTLDDSSVRATREFEVGKSLFAFASCVACHKMNGQGREFGPDLTKLDAKKQSLQHLLESLVDPSKQIDKKYQAYAFRMDDGKVYTGLVVKETPKTIEIAVDPVANAKPTVLQKDEIEAQKKSDVSTMPKGLLSKLSEEEILDLLAYVYSKGNQKHPLFKQ